MEVLPALMVMLQFLAETDLTETGTKPLLLKGGKEEEGWIIHISKS
jgi:hypothetical protein